MEQLSPLRHSYEGMTEESRSSDPGILGFDQTAADVEAFITAFTDVVRRARSFG